MVLAEVLYSVKMSLWLTVGFRIAGVLAVVIATWIIIRARRQRRLRILGKRAGATFIAVLAFAWIASLFWYVTNQSSKCIAFCSFPGILHV